MSRTFKFTRAPYDKGDNIYDKATFTFEPGVSVLVGCNGSGKTTLLNHIEREVEKDENSIVVAFNNLHDGGSYSISKDIFLDNIAMAATKMCSSEGETISQNIGSVAAKIGRTVRVNKDNTKDLFILFDAIDSGLSIDNIEKTKNDLFNVILKDCAGKRDVYIICSANEYELCNGQKCFDVQGVKYKEFKDYEDYRKFIIKSREKKDGRFE